MEAGFPCHSRPCHVGSDTWTVLRWPTRCALTSLPFPPLRMPGGNQATTTTTSTSTPTSNTPPLQVDPRKHHPRPIGLNSLVCFITPVREVDPRNWHCPWPTRLAVAPPPPSPLTTSPPHAALPLPPLATSPPHAASPLPPLATSPPHAASPLPPLAQAATAPPPLVTPLLHSLTIPPPFWLHHFRIQLHRLHFGCTASAPQLRHRRPQTRPPLPFTL